MVITVVGGVVNCTDINDDVAFLYVETAMISTNQTRLPSYRTSRSSGFLLRTIKVFGDGRKSGRVLSMLIATTSSQ
jgi:hypothetical protein